MVKRLEDYNFTEDDFGFEEFEKKVNLAAKR